MADETIDGIGWKLQMCLGNRKQSLLKKPHAFIQLDKRGYDGEARPPIQMELDHASLYHLFDQIEQIQEQLDALAN